MSQYFNETIYNDMQQTELTFPTLEWTGFDHSTKVQRLSHIFNSDQMTEMQERVGKSIFMTHLFTEVVKAKDEDTTFNELLQLKDPVFMTIKRQFEHRLNKIYLHPSLGELLDSGEIDFALLQIFEELVAHSEKAFTCNSFYAMNELIVSPIFEALFDCNIIWKSKYFDYFTIEHRMYAIVMHDWCYRKRATMNSYDKMMFYLFKKSKGIKLGTRYSGMATVKDWEVSSGKSSKAAADWELAELYFDVPKDGDELRNVIH